MPDDWRNFLLRAIVAPESAVNLTALQAWQQSETQNFACNNYLNASDQITGWRPQPGSDFIPCYPTLGAMIRLYKRKLDSSTYAGIREALRRSKSLADVWLAIHASGWCGGSNWRTCQEGKYPIRLWQVAFAHVAPPLSLPLGAEGSTTAPPRDAQPPGPLPSQKPGPNWDDLHRAWDRLTHALGVEWPYEHRRIVRATTSLRATVAIPPPADTSDVPGEYLHPP